MSKIKDLLAEEQHIDDLMPTKTLGDVVFNKAINAPDLKEWMSGNAEFTVGENDMGQKETYWENFMGLCQRHATDTIDDYIEEQHLDISDTIYFGVIDEVACRLADKLADFESECIRNAEESTKELLYRLREKNGEC